MYPFNGMQKISIFLCVSKYAFYKCSIVIYHILGTNVKLYVNIFTDIEMNRNLLLRPSLGCMSG